MATIATQQMATTGTVTFATPAASDNFSPAYGMFAVYKNTNAATRTITIVLSHLTLESGDAHPNKAYTLAALTGELFIPLLPAYAKTDGTVDITTSAQTNVSVAAVRIWQ